jgi:hypothetical protein
MDLVDLGSSKLDERTNALLVQCKSAPVGNDENEAPDFGQVPIVGVGCVTGRPWPKDERGVAQGVVAEDLPGCNGAVVAWRDTRVASVVAELGPGEGCLHSTGPDFDSRVFVKDQLAAMIVGDDCAMVMDRKNKKFSITCFGLHFEMSEENGLVFTDGNGTVQIKGAVMATGQVVLGGRTPPRQHQACFSASSYRSRRSTLRPSCRRCTCRSCRPGCRRSS